MPYFVPVSPDEPLVERVIHTRSQTFKFRNQSQNKDGTPFDFNGMTIVTEIKDRPGGTVVVTIPDDNVQLAQSAEGATAGAFDIFEITHPPADFATLTARPFEYFFDIKITDALGEIFLPILGPFVIRED